MNDKHFNRLVCKIGGQLEFFWFLLTCFQAYFLFQYMFKTFMSGKIYIFFFFGGGDTYNLQKTQKNDYLCFLDAVAYLKFNSDLDGI